MNPRRDRLERVASLLASTMGVKPAVDMAEQLLAEVDARTAPRDAAAKLDEVLVAVCGEGATHETHDIVAAVKDVLRERDAAMAQARSVPPRSR